MCIMKWAVFLWWYWILTYNSLDSATYEFSQTLFVCDCYMEIPILCYNVLKIIKFDFIFTNMGLKINHSKNPKLKSLWLLTSKHSFLADLKFFSLAYLFEAYYDCLMYRQKKYLFRKCDNIMTFLLNVHVTNCFVLASYFVYVVYFVYFIRLMYMTSNSGIRFSLYFRQTIFWLFTCPLNQWYVF